MSADTYQWVKTDDVGPWYIDTDGKTVLTWTCNSRWRGDTGILLSDGRMLSESQYMGGAQCVIGWSAEDERAVYDQCVGRIFASHPDQNPNICTDSNGVYVWLPTNQSFKIGSK